MKAAGAQVLLPGKFPTLAILETLPDLRGRYSGGLKDIICLDRKSTSFKAENIVG